MLTHAIAGFMSIAVRLSEAFASLHTIDWQSIVSPACSTDSPPAVWKTWPFELPGQETTVGALVLKGFFLLLILALIALLLRFLFGPRGVLREPWMDEKDEKDEKDEAQPRQPKQNEDKQE